MKIFNFLLMAFIFLGILSEYGFGQNSISADSAFITTNSDSAYTAIEKSAFSKNGDLFYIGIDKNSLAFDYDAIKANQESFSKFVKVTNVRFNDRKMSFNRDIDEALYYVNYDLTFKVNSDMFHVDGVRETGVLKLRNGRWEIVQQHASAPIVDNIWPAYLVKEPVNSGPLYKFNAPELLEDYDLFTLALSEAHAGLYNYITPKNYEMLIDSVKKSLTLPMCELEFYRLLSHQIAEIKCGHTNISLSDQTVNYLNKQSIFFPFRLKFISGKAYVSESLSGNAINPGSEIIAINNLPISVIVADIFKMQNSDGGIISAKYKKLEEKFHELYCRYIEQTLSFTIKYIPYKSNVSKEITVSGIGNDEWREKSRDNNAEQKKPLSFKIIENYNIALLDIRKFVNQEINETHGSFQRFMDSAFAIIGKKKIQNLIIDLRGNGGGDIAQELLPYLIEKPVQYFKIIDAPKTRFSFLEYTDKGIFFNEVNSNLWRKYKNKNGRYELDDDFMRLIYPNKYVFSGGVYVLIDGNTFSGAAEVSALLHDQRRATFFGEETGGSYHGSSSGDFLNLTLPHTQIKVSIPIRNYVINVDENSSIGRGVIPDIAICNSIDDYLIENDAEIKYVISYILKREK